MMSPSYGPHDKSIHTFFSLFSVCVDDGSECVCVCVGGGGGYIFLGAGRGLGAIFLPPTFFFFIFLNFPSILNRNEKY